MIVRPFENKNRDRMKAALGVAAFHALLGYALITGLGTHIATTVSDRLKAFDVLPEQPPPPLEEAEPATKRMPQEEGAAAPPNLKAKPSPVVAPPPLVRLKVPPPVVTAPLPSRVTGSDPSAGASNLPGPGTGSGGVGAGTGSGGQGTGPGGGGGGSKAVRLSGSISGATDYPRAARRAGIEGSVVVRFTVRTDGSVRNCEVIRS
ncbi:MAG: TonB family protein, partial [Pseudomonadota bacterium]|nr:TonB family protein [Pseudomonadota bacterium]